MMKRFALITIMIALIAITANAEIIDFEDLSLEADSYVNDTPFSSGSAAFNNYYDSFNGYWESFSYSNMSDTQDASYDNQLSSVTGTAASGSNYAVAFYGFYDVPTITFDSVSEVHGMSVTNTYLTATSLLTGSVSKKFGGTTGNDPDWFKLTIQGLDQDDNSTGTVDFYLADYTDEDNSLDYVVQSWETVDLSSLGEVKSLKFTMSSTDYNQYGMLTPGYFALDDISLTPVPEPATVALLGLGGFLLRRKRNA